MATARGGYVHAVGRRKTAVARVFLKPGSGSFLVNGKTFSDYFGRETSQMVVRSPLVILESDGKFDVVVNVVGGGKSGQAGAIRHGLSRALKELSLKEDKVEEAHKLRQAGYLTRDAREVERKKYGLHKARKRPQYSKR